MGMERLASGEAASARLPVRSDVAEGIVSDKGTDMEARVPAAPPMAPVVSRGSVEVAPLSLDEPSGVLAPIVAKDDPQTAVGDASATKLPDVPSVPRGGRR